MSTTLQNFYKATITKNWTASTGDFNVSVKPTTSSGWLVISANNTTLREIIKYTATGTNAYGDFVTVSDIGDRGIGGTTAQTHTIGETIRMNITAEHWEEMQDDINSIIASGLPAGTNGQSIVHNGSAWVADNITKFSTLNIFDGTMPTSWTDLNLSSIIGVRQRMVLIKLYDTSASTTVSFRPNGDTTDYSLASEGSNVGLWDLSVGSTANVAYTTIVKTDTSGIIEWVAGSGTGKIDVLAYW